MTNDVTAGYIVADVERLRKPMQLITDYTLKCMGVVKSAAIIAIQPIKKETKEQPTANLRLKLWHKTCVRSLVKALLQGTY